MKSLQKAISRSFTSPLIVPDYPKMYFSAFKEEMGLRKGVGKYSFLQLF